MKIPKGPWRFDGHGINAADGTRICKVTHLEPYTHESGQPVRNKEFDELSILIASCPQMLETLEWVREFARRQKSLSPEDMMGIWSQLQAKVTQTLSRVEGGV